MKQIVIKTLIFLYIINALSICSVNAASNPYKQSGPYGTNCTWYAWKMAYEKAGVTLPGWGNAKEWYNDAKNSGYTVSTTPKANSIIVWGGWTSYGHVGYVERVSGNTLYMWDSTGPCINQNDPTYQECLKNSWNENTDRACKEKAPKAACEYTISPDEYGITGYIYLNNTPKKSVTNTNKKEPQPIIKSNNANLKNINFSVGKINFKKDVLEYKIKVKNEIDKITITSSLEDLKAKVEGNGEYKLKVGVNEIKLIVKAEDGTTKEYKINVIRDIKNKVKKEKEKVNKNSLNIIIIVDILIIIITIITIFIIEKRKHKKNQK